MSVVSVKCVLHRGEKRIAIYFENSVELNARVRKLEGVKWSNQLKAWHIPDSPENRIRFHIDPPLLLSIAHQTKVNSFKRWLKSKRYSDNTIKAYSEALISFLKFYNLKPVDEINHHDVIAFNNDYILKNNLSASYQNQIVNAIKLFFTKIEGKAMQLDLIHRPKRANVLPNVLSKEEVKAILEATANVKHKTMLSLIYACGLRSGELINIKLVDVDSKRGLLLIKQAKGKKDRIAPLGDKIIEMLRHYYLSFKPKVYLFEGIAEGEPYNIRSLQQVLKLSLQKTTIKKPVTLHWLRHSYATHLLENGTDLRYIQEILGHKSSKTTEIYTHVSTKSIQKITSPFDFL